MPRLLFLFALLLFFPLPSSAQDDDVKPLSEILNPPIDYGNDGKPLTSQIMANYYFKNCIKEDTLVFEQDEKELLCACSAANMSQHLSVEEFKALDKDTVKGRNARGKAIVNGYTPCMEYVMESKIMRDCSKSKQLRDIIIGKSKMCGCTTNYMKSFMTRDGAYLIMNTLEQHPMSLDPLEYYFREDGYFNQLEHYLKGCIRTEKYGQDRR